MPKNEVKQRGSDRWYPCPKCGNDHPSCTTLLGVIGSKALMGWSAKNGVAKLKVLASLVEADAPDTFKTKWAPAAEAQWKLTEDTAFWKSGKETGQEAADYGQLAHSWIEAYLNGKEVTLESLPGPSRLAVEAFKGLEKANTLEVIKTEQTFYNCAMNYAGTADIVCKLNGELSLGDWKTSNGIFSNYPIQAWSYALADEMQHGDRLYTQVFIGRFGKDGACEVKIFKRNDFPGIETARKIMEGCGTIFRFNQEWDRLFPYVKPTKKEIKDATPATIQ